jgi:hypothetical protein
MNRNNKSRLPAISFTTDTDTLMAREEHHGTRLSNYEAPLMS